MLSRRYLSSRLMLSYQMVLMCTLHIFFSLGVFLLAFFLDAGSPHGFAWARALGHANMANLAVLLLPVSRTSPLLFAFSSIDFDSALMFHKFVARLFVLSLLVHALTFSVVLVMDRMSSPTFFSDHFVGLLGGFVAGGAVLIMVATAWFQGVRKRAFELFYLLHHLFVCVVLGAAIHTMYMMNSGLAITGRIDWNQDLVIYYLAVPVSIYIVDRILRIVDSFKIVELARLQVFPSSVKLRFRSDRSFRPGQFAMIQCAHVSRIEWHPFAVSGFDGAGHVEFDVFCIGGRTSWTRRLYQAAKETEKSDGEDLGYASQDFLNDNIQLMFDRTLQFRMTGPYGQGFVRDGEYSEVLFVCGGMGITSVMGQYVSMVKSRKRFVWVFREMESAFQPFFDTIPKEERDLFIFLQTSQPLINEAAPQEKLTWPKTVVRVGPRPRLDVFVEQMGVRGSSGCVICSGPMEFTRDLCAAAASRKFHFSYSSFSV